MDELIQKRVLELGSTKEVSWSSFTPKQQAEIYGKALTNVLERNKGEGHFTMHVDGRLLLINYWANHGKHRGYNISLFQDEIVEIEFTLPDYEEEMRKRPEVLDCSDELSAQESQDLQMELEGLTSVVHIPANDGYKEVYVELSLSAEEPSVGSHVSGEIAAMSIDQFKTS